jgi:hypothetical protein
MLIRSKYILPRMPKPMSKPSNLAPGQERSITVLVKSARNPPLDLKLSSQSPITSILDVKTSVSKETKIPVEKIKVLHKKKPVPDSKVLKDLLGEGESSIEFSVMVLGGAAAVPTATASQPVAATSPTGAAVLETAQFWDDLKGFLSQRIKDEQEAQELTALFKSSWESKR